MGDMVGNTWGKSLHAKLLALVAAIVIPVAANAQRSAPQPLGDVTTWVTSDDYPPAAMRAKEGGLVTITLAIDATGVPTGCSVVSSSHSAILDAKTCEVMMRPAHRFSAARDDEGTAVAGVFRRSILWSLPEDDGTMGPLTASAATFRLTIDADGVTTGCGATAVPNGEAFDPGPRCEMLHQWILYATRDANTGKHHRRDAVIVMTIDRVVANGTPLIDEMAGDMTLLQKWDLRYVVRADGSLDDCFAVTIFGSPMTGSMPCEDPARYAPADAEQPVREIHRIAYRYLKP